MNHIPETEKGHKRLIKRIGEDLVERFIEHRVADLRAMDVARVENEIAANISMGNKLVEIINSKSPLSVEDLDINGNDIINQFDLQEGPVIGEVLDFLLDNVLDDPYINSREKLMELAADFLAKYY
jgi:poly(A) polymerase/tRNA nucleotidyltransferase (CCA-adding enzyme)